MLGYHNSPKQSSGTQTSMANAEQLLNEAQYAFQSVSYGETPGNKRHAARAKSLCRKIIRKFPTSSYASEAHAILRRLGEEAYSSKMNVEHRHVAPSEHHTAPTAKPLAMTQTKPQTRPIRQDETMSFDWAGLLAVILMTSKTVLAVIVFVGFVLFGIFGPLLLLPLIAFVLLTGPFRQLLKPQQRQDMNVFVVRANTFIEERRKSGTGFA